MQFLGKVVDMPVLMQHWCFWSRQCKTLSGGTQVQFLDQFGNDRCFGPDSAEHCLEVYMSSSWTRLSCPCCATTGFSTRQPALFFSRVRRGQGGVSAACSVPSWFDAQWCQITGKRGGDPACASQVSGRLKLVLDCCMAGVLRVTKTHA